MTQDYEEGMVVDEGETTSYDKEDHVTMEKVSNTEKLGVHLEESEEHETAMEDDDEIPSTSRKQANEDLLSSDEEDFSAKRNVSRKLILSDESEEEQVEPDGDEEEELLDIPHSNQAVKSSVVPGRVLDPDIYGDEGDSSDDGMDSRKKKTYERNSSGLSSNEDDEWKERTDKEQSKKADKKKVQRKASAKSRAKILQAITSETQKLVREKSISLPYHKPKQLTLDQFLKKRNQAKSAVFSTIAQQPSALGSMLNTLVKLQEDILPVIAKAEEEKKDILKDSTVNGKGLEEEDDDDDEDMLERPNVTGEYQPSKEKVGGWLEKEVTTICEDEPAGDDATTSLCGDQINEESFAEERTSAPIDSTAVEKEIPPANETHSTDEIDLPVTNVHNNSAGTLEKSNDSVIVDEVIEVDGAEETVQQKEKVAEEETKRTEINQSILEGEAELASFLEEMRPKPKRLTLAERLKAMPGFEKLASARPRIGGGQAPSSGVIELDNFKKPSSKGIKKEKNIQTLMDRFLKHNGLGTNSPCPKERHHIIHVNTLEKDSQGEVQDIKTDEFDYVTNSEENEDLLDMIVKPKKGLSPSGRREAVPGEKMVRLREALKQRIRLKKTKEYENRLEEAEASKKIDEENEGSEEEIMEDEDFEISDSEEDEELLEEDDMPKKKKKKKTKSPFVNAEAEEEDEDEDDREADEDEEEHSSEESEDDDITEVENSISDEAIPVVSQKKKACRKIIYSDDEDEDLPTDQKSEEETHENLDVTLPSPTQSDKCDDQDKSELIANLVHSSALGSLVQPATDDDMADLCSGRFPSQAPLTPVESQSDCFGFDVDDDEDNVEKTNVTLEDKESDDDEDDSESLFCKVSSKPIPKDTEEVKEQKSDGPVKSPIIAESDEDETPGDDLSAGYEEDIQEVEEEDEELLDDDEDDEEAALERELKARSLQQSVTPKRKSSGLFGEGGRLRRKFFENEAELSGSENDSGDEDEKGINYYEDEEGDGDELDEDEVKNQVERAHLKQLLDQDDREIRFLQEEYLERGDLEDGKLRVRKFRWTDVDDAWGDDAAMMGDSDGEDGHGNEDEEELKKRIDEIEKRKWLLEHPEIMEACAEESQKQLLQENTKFLKLGSRNQKKIESFLESSCSMIMNETSSSIPDTSFATLVKSQIKASAKLMLRQKEKKETTPLNDVNLNGQQDPNSTPPSNKASSSQKSLFEKFTSPDDLTSKIKRGSFLSRGSPTLSRLAEITKSNDGNGSNNIKSNSRNFVFSVVTPPDQQNKQKVAKRPAASNSQGKILTKKIKIDRSFSNLDDSSKDNSIFKYM